MRRDVLIGIWALFEAPTCGGFVMDGDGPPGPALEGKANQGGGPDGGTAAGLAAPPVIGGVSFSGVDAGCCTSHCLSPVEAPVMSSIPRFHYRDEPRQIGTSS